MRLTPCGLIDRYQRFLEEGSSTYLCNTGSYVPNGTVSNLVRLGQIFAYMNDVTEAHID